MDLPKSFTADQTRFTESSYVSAKIYSTSLRVAKQLDDIDVDLRLSVIKRLHAKWLIALYNYLTPRKRLPPRKKLG